MASELQVNTITEATSGSGITFAKDVIPATPLSHRNMIINGAMSVYQRLAVNTEVAATNNGTFSADRFRFWSNVGSSLPESQVRNDDAPAGFKYSWKRTTNAGSSIASNSYDAVLTKIEGYDIAHLNFGTSNAKTVTFSFYVKSSIAGTFSIMFANADNSRVLLKEYTVNSANTWERKTITFTGATDGTWNIGNGIGLTILFGLGYGSNYTSSTVNSWLSSAKYQTTSSSTAIATTNGATFQLTGLQLELGSVATPFEHISYADELTRCQRYFQTFASTHENDQIGWMGMSFGANSVYMPVQFYQPMRSQPTILSGGSWSTRATNDQTFTADFGYQRAGKYGCVLVQGNSSLPTQSAGTAFWVETQNQNCQLQFEAEL